MSVTSEKVKLTPTERNWGWTWVDDSLSIIISTSAHCVWQLTAEKKVLLAVECCTKLWVGSSKRFHLFSKRKNTCRNCVGDKCVLSSEHAQKAAQKCSNAWQYHSSTHLHGKNKNFFKRKERKKKQFQKLNPSASNETEGEQPAPMLPGETGSVWVDKRKKNISRKVLESSIHLVKRAGLAVEADCGKDEMIGSGVGEEPLQAGGDETANRGSQAHLNKS